jgi:hypothetical protein
MQFNLKIVSAGKSTLINAIVEYSNNTFYVTIGGVKYLFDTNIKKNTKKLFSKPTNDNYKSWTKKKYKYSSTHRFNLIERYWSIVKPGSKVSGLVEDGVFIIKKIK